MENQFSVVDYVVFGLMLMVSSAIGIYHAYGGKQSSTKEYLMAGKNMHWFPIFVSLLASYLSAITLLGVPSEIYTYGVQYFVLIISYFILVPVAAVLYAPMFFKLDVTSANEYLERRFNGVVRSLGCCLFMVQYVLYLSVVLYAPSLALEAVAGVPLTASIITTGLVCNFYTTLGGMKAVIWTDVFQASVMVLGLIVVAIIGSIEVGGMGNVFLYAKQGSRLNLFDFNPDPTVRNTFWTLAIGGAFTAMPVWTVSQTAVQRFMAAKSLRDAKKAIYCNIPGLIFIVSLCVLDGLVIYAVYHTCDLKYDKKVTSNDQVLPYFIIHKLGHLKGVPGLFTACLFSGALSTASSGLNSIAAITLEDIVKKVVPSLDDRVSTIVSKVIACTFGLVIIGGAFLVSLVGTMVLQLAYSIFGIVGGPCMGLFALGMLVPKANSKGGFIGTIIGVALTLWIAVGAFQFKPDVNQAPMSIRGCADFNATVMNMSADGMIYYQAPVHDTPLAKFYSISYLWYAFIGSASTFLFGWLLSLLFRLCCHEEEGDPELIFDVKYFFWSLLPVRWRPIEYRLEKTSYQVDEMNESIMMTNSVADTKSEDRYRQEPFART